MSKKPSNVRQLLTQMGRTGLNQWGGIVSEEWYPPLQGAAGARIYRMMADNSAIISAGLYSAEMLISKAPWRIVEASDKRADLEARDFIKSAFFDMNPSWVETLPSILTNMTYGWAYHEKLFKRRNGPDHWNPNLQSQHDDGMIGWKSFDLRSQDSLIRWEFDEETDEILGMWQMPAPTFEEKFVPFSKSLLFRTRWTKNNPEGISMLRGAWKSWRYAEAIQEYEAMGVERDLAGMGVLYAPDEVVNPKKGNKESQKAHRRAVELVTHVKRGEEEGLLLPSTRDANGHLKYEFKLLGSSGTRQINTSQIINRYDSRIAMTMLADFLLLGMQRQGSYALAATKSELYEASLRTIADRICAVVNTYAIPELLRINPLDEEIARPPQLICGDLSVPDISQVCDLIRTLSGAQDILKDDLELENHVRRKAGLPSRKAPATTELSKSGTSPGQLAPGVIESYRRRFPRAILRRAA